MRYKQISSNIGTTRGAGTLTDFIPVFLKKSTFQMNQSSTIFEPSEIAGTLLPVHKFDMLVQVPVQLVL
jgi:hypothetical protein